MLVALLVGIIIALLVSYLFARTIADPVKHVSQAMTAMSKGDFRRESIMTDQVTRSLRRRDEIGTLGQAMETMRTSLEE
ncbi:MAG TPA: HAMP domain-containing protein [Treponemataceae bacterium]|nr:HAMP domain-containing protein [Treponemataceae bacterium]